MAHEDLHQRDREPLKDYIDRLQAFKKGMGAIPNGHPVHQLLIDAKLERKNRKAERRRTPTMRALEAARRNGADGPALKEIKRLFVSLTDAEREAFFVWWSSKGAALASKKK
jgi:hypothetical protein